MNFSEQELNIIALIWIFFAIFILPLLLKIKAPYGRHINKKWGLLIPNRLGWFIMEVPSLIIILYYFIQNVNIHTRFLILVFLLWIFHYAHRSLFFPFMTRTKHKKIPLSIVLMGIFFNFVNADLNGYFMSHFFDGQELTPLLTFRFGFGLFLFVIGMYINIRADYKLIKLRKTATNGYKIPRGWLFDFISCPNYFGEILEWLGFAVIAWNLPALSFFVWTVANLLPRALSNHKWYLENFKDYPKERKALIPFVL